MTLVLEHWADLLAGLILKVQTDHKLLAPLLSMKLTDEKTIRIKHYRMRLYNMRYDFSTDNVQGKEFYTAETFSHV